MINGINVICDTSILITLILCILFPIFLFFIARFKIYQGKNASQFFICMLVTMLIWLSSLMAVTQLFSLSMELILTNIFIMICALLVYLEIWGLLSRGYTLSLLLTFYKAKKPLNIEELGNSYRSGYGLKWLIEHRFAGLEAAGMLRTNGDKVTLTYKGVIIVFVYQLFIRIFGLKVTG